MENGTRKIGIRAAAGFLVAITIILAVFASGIQLPTVKAKTGTLTVLLTDAPADLKHLNITIDSLLALNVDDPEDESETPAKLVTDISGRIATLLANGTEEEKA